MMIKNFWSVVDCACKEWSICWKPMTKLFIGAPGKKPFIYLCNHRNNALFVFSPITNPNYWVPPTLFFSNIHSYFHPNFLPPTVFIKRILSSSRPFNSCAILFQSNWSVVCSVCPVLSEKFWLSFISFLHQQMTNRIPNEKLLSFYD